jgi:hypothetical protein
MKVLFLVTRLDRPSARFRVEPVRPWFESRGHSFEIVPLPKGALARLGFYSRLSTYDVIAVQQRLIEPLEIAALRRHCRALIYDLDDAVMFDSRGARAARRERRFRAIARASHLVVCGNRYLAGETARHTDRGITIPTAIDTQRFHPAARRERSGPVTIGWTGSSSTNPYLNEILPVLAQLSGDVRLKVISGSTAGLDFRRLDRIPHEFVAWSPEREVLETASFDIGLMPLPDNSWTRGKCGCKALQYMALGIPAVCSPSA